MQHELVAFDDRLQLGLERIGGTGFDAAGS